MVCSDPTQMEMLRIFIGVGIVFLIVAYALGKPACAQHGIHPDQCKSQHRD